MPDLTGALRELRDGMATSGTLSAALCDWSSTDTRVQRVANLARLGAPLSVALRPLRGLPHGDLVVQGLIVAAGTDEVGALDRIIRTLGSTELTRHERRSAALPAKLSGRLLGAIALCVVVGASISGVGTSLVALVIAAILSAVGVYWTRRLLSTPQGGDATAMDVGSLAALIGGGLGPHEAMRCIGWAVPARLATLGADWRRALRGTPDGAALGDLLDRMSRDGSVGVGHFQDLAERMRERDRRSADLRTKRLPVMLVFPLTLCFLPAFAVIMGQPLVRAFAQ